MCNRFVKCASKTRFFGLSEEIKPKMQLSGKVAKIGLAGAVIDIGTDQPAAIHVSQIINPTNEPIKRVEDVLDEGQEIDVWVKRIRNERIELTMFKPLDLEWREIKTGMVVKGKVTRLEKFGAFVDIGAERPGLIHISELAHGYIHTPSEVVKEDEDVEAQILEVNRRKKQIKLSLKALQPLPEEISEILDEDAGASKKRGKVDQRKKDKKNAGDTSDKNNAKNLDQEAGEESVDTALGAALREAMDRAKGSDDDQIEEKTKKGKNTSLEQEDILNRTLEHRSSSSSSTPEVAE